MIASDVQQYSRSILTCSVLEATITLLLSCGNGRTVCSSCSAPVDEPHEVEVTDVDRLGFITGVQCPKCPDKIALSPLEESYIVQMLHHGQLDQIDAMQRGGSRDYVEQNLNELCERLRRHSFYENAICPERENDDRDSCRVIGIDGQTGEVNEVEFVAQGYDQGLTITCRSGCYYAKYPSARYERSYKEKVRALLERANESCSSRKAILSCTVLDGTATILRRHNIDNTLCQNCKNDDHEFLEVKEIDDLGFIKSVECVNCRQSTFAEQSTACYRLRFYYEEIDETMSLERGDHVSWHRNLAYWHHAIVTRVDSETVTLAEYIPRDNRCHLKLMETTKPRRDVSLSFDSGIPYRVTYDDCYTNEYTALRAERSIDEEQYHVTNRNCEHLSYWCKTGLPGSDQVKTLTRSTWKTFLAYILRVVNILLLTVFQVIHEKREGNQTDKIAFKRFERILISVYMSIVFLLFLSWSLYTELKKVKKLNVRNRCCNRPACVVSGLHLRIITRELFAFAGPFFVIFFEDRTINWFGKFLPLDDSDWKKLVVISALFLVVSFLSYGFGAVLGTVFQHMSRRCSIRLRKRPSCMGTSAEADTQMRRVCNDTEKSVLPENMHEELG